MAESAAEPGSKKSGLARTMAKKALAPLLASLASALSGYLARKASVLAQEKLVPRLREKGGAKAVAQEAVSAVAEKVGGDGESSRDAERRNRERRRNQRRQALEQSGSS